MPKKYVKRVRKGLRRIKRRTRRVGRLRGKNRATLGMTVAKFPGKNPFSRRYFTKLTYSDIITISGGATLRSVDRVFSMNSVYDPDVTGTGHQPRFYDQLSALYGTYRVTGAKIKAKFMPTDSTVPQQNHYLTVIPSQDPSNLNNSTYLNLNELPYSKSTFGNLYGSRSHVSMYHPVSRIQGVAPSVVRNEDSFAAQNTNSPLSRCYFHVVAGTLDEANLNISGRLLVEITYYVMWEDPLTPSAS